MARPHSRPRPLSRHTVSRRLRPRHTVRLPAIPRRLRPGIDGWFFFPQPAQPATPAAPVYDPNAASYNQYGQYGQPSQPAQSAQPSYGQPAAPAYDPNNAYAQPDYNQANYGQQGYAAPSYNQSVYTQPAYAQQPAYGQPVAPAGYAQKSKLAAGLLGIFLGCFGVHNFYLGNTGKAVAQLLLTVIGWVFIIGPARAGLL